MIERCSPDAWRAAVNRMRACCPPPEGFAWRFIRSRLLEDCVGDCSRTQRTVVVRVEKDLAETETIEVLIHEVAHAYDAWTHHSWAGDHSDTFWIWVGRVYRRFHGEN